MTGVVREERRDLRAGVLRWGQLLAAERAAIRQARQSFLQLTERKQSIEGEAAKVALEMTREAVLARDDIDEGEFRKATASENAQRMSTAHAFNLANRPAVY